MEQNDGGVGITWAKVANGDRAPVGKFEQVPLGELWSVGGVCPGALVVEIGFVELAQTDSTFSTFTVSEPLGAS